MTSSGGRSENDPPVATANSFWSSSSFLASEGLILKCLPTIATMSMETLWGLIGYQVIEAQRLWSDSLKVSSPLVACKPIDQDYTTQQAVTLMLYLPEDYYL